jgi:Sec-independent protein translocase protein TatA
MELTQILNFKMLVQTVKLAAVAVLFFTAFTASAATLSLSPSTGVYTAGSTFTASVKVNTNGAAINAADGTLTFNPKEITVLGVSKGAIFNLWTAEPAYSNSAGTITFSGGSPTGYTGSGGTVISITFKANAAGSPKVSFSKGSVLAADGKGTNVLTTMNGGSFTIAAAGVSPEPEEIEYEYVPPANTPGAPIVESSTHPDSSKWYSVKDAQLSWSLPSGVTSVRTLLDDKAGSIPTKVYDSPIRELSIEALDEGVSYFHIQFKNADGWGKVAHYRLAVDSEKPSKFDIALASDADLSNPVQTLVFTTEDSGSKVKRFLVQLDGGEPFEYLDETGSSTMQLPSLLPGHHSVIIEAFDEAGNSIISTFSFSILAFDKPQFTEYPSEINEQVIPVIKGITRPNSKVKVTMTQTGLGVSTAYASKEYEVQSNGGGEFVFIPDGRLSLGVYELTAVAVDQYGAQSDPSDTIRIAVQQPGYIQLGAFVVSVLSVIIPLLALCGLLVLGTWFLLFRLRSLKKGVGRETKEALSMLASEFQNLEAQVQNQKKQLEDARKTKKLTKAESELIATLTSALKESQKRVEKEIEDVEDLVD